MEWTGLAAGSNHRLAIVRGVVVASGSSAWAYYTPNIPSVVGASFYLQGSAGGTVVIGG